MGFCKNHRWLLRGAGSVFFLLLTACAATVPPPELPDRTLTWQALPELPEAIRQKLSGSQIQQIPAEDGTLVPVRIFGASGRHTPVLMAHGLQSHSGWFTQSAAFLADLGHPVYVIDRRGSGLSQAPRGDTKDFHLWADDIATIGAYALEQHGGQQFFLLGHCFGAIPATLYAERMPANIKGLILTTPGIFTHTSIPLAQMLKIITTSAGNRDYYFPVPLDADQFSELPEYEPFIAADPLALRAVTGDLYWQIHKARQYIVANAGHLSMPILVGLAGEDEIADNRKNRQWLGDVPALDKTEIIYPDARHILEYSLEQKRYFQDLRWWLSWIEER